MNDGVGRRDRWEGWVGEEQWSREEGWVGEEG